MKNDKSINLSKGYTGDTEKHGYTGYTGQGWRTGFPGDNSFDLYPKIASPKIAEPEQTLIEQLNVARTLPLECCGLIIQVDIGVKGMSPEESDKHISHFINNYRDNNDVIRKCVKFYKEYFTTNPDSTKTTIKTTLI